MPALQPKTPERLENSRRIMQVSERKDEESKGGNVDQGSTAIFFSIIFMEGMPRRDVRSGKNVRLKRR
jgi:hypothetical protein